MYLNDKLLKIIVFNFSNWGERVNKEYIGQKISDIILDNLIKYGINVEQSKGIEPKFQIVGTRPPEESAATFYFNENFRKMAPFIFIVGCVKAYEKDRYNIIVRIGRLNTNLKINYVMLKKYKLSSLTPKNIKLKSDKITKDIYTKIKM